MMDPVDRLTFEYLVKRVALLEKVVGLLIRETERLSEMPLPRQELIRAIRDAGWE
jgi:hypothetical protein